MSDWTRGRGHRFGKVDQEAQEYMAGHPCVAGKLGEIA